MTTIDNALKNKLSGLYYGSRIILPMKFHLLKVIVENEIITDFSPSSKGAFVREEEDFTDLYFYDFKNLKDTVSKYEAIKMIAVEKDKSIFDSKNHIKLALYLEEGSKVKIEKTDEDILFIE